MRSPWVEIRLTLAQVMLGWALNIAGRHWSYDTLQRFHALMQGLAKERAV